MYTIMSKEEESLKHTFGPSINCLESNVTFTNCTWCIAEELLVRKSESAKDQASLASAGTGHYHVMLLASTCVVTGKACNQVYLHHMH